MRTRLLKYASLILLSGFLLAPGCSSTPPNDADIQHWIDEHQYQSANQALRDQAQPDLKRINQIEYASKQESQELLKQVNELVAAHDWSAARAKLTEAQQHLLPSKELNEAATLVTTKQNNYLQQAHVEEAIQHANWVAERIRLERASQGSSEEKMWSGLTLTRLEKEQEEVVAELLGITQESVKAHNFVLARRAYSAIRKLATTKIQQEEIARLGQEIEKSAAKEALVQAPAASAPTPSQAQPKEPARPSRKEILANLQHELDDAINSGDLFKTKAAVVALQKQQPLEKPAQERVDTINSFLKEKVSTLNREADNLYKTGKITEANTIWAMALRLDENNDDIKKKIDRSAKVLENMEVLRQEQAQAK